MITLPGQLSHGMPARHPAVENARNLKDLQRQVDALRGALINQGTTIATLGPSGSAAVDLTTSQVAYALGPVVTVPQGMTRMTFEVTAQAASQAPAGGSTTINVAVVWSQNGGAFNLSQGTLSQTTPASGWATATEAIQGSISVTPGDTWQFAAAASYSGAAPVASTGREWVTGVAFWSPV